MFPEGQGQSRSICFIVNGVSLDYSGDDENTSGGSSIRQQFECKHLENSSSFCFTA